MELKKITAEMKASEECLEIKLRKSPRKAVGGKNKELENERKKMKKLELS